MSTREPQNEEELRAALEEQMRRITVTDVLVQTAVTLVNLAGRRLGLTAPGEEEAGDRDLDQARLAIEALRALLPMLPEDVSRQLREPLDQLQLAYAREAKGEAAPPPGREESGAPPKGGDERAQEADRAKARSKIWTPPGT
jgi:hypothetical protein